MDLQFICLVGLSGSGKSFHAQEIAKQIGGFVISSDYYRQKIYGAEEIQGDNNKLFEKIHVDIIDLLSSGNSVIFDATNLSMKNRVALLQKINKINCKKTAIVMATEYKKCLEYNQSRDRIVPAHIINRQWKSFQIPLWSEGWDDILLNFNYNSDGYKWDELITSMTKFNQDNPHHSGTLGQHTNNVYRWLLNENEDLRYAAMLHDNGKLFTQVYHDAKGNPRDYASYFNHENCGSYEAMFYLNQDRIEFKRIIWICGIIGLHMMPYNFNTEKAVNKFIQKYGEDMYYDVMKLNEADRNSK